MKTIFLFLDGVGLGERDPSRNPFMVAKTPFLDLILEGNKLCRGTPFYTNDSVSLYELDACLGVGGVPQSATGQAIILTGMNIPQLIGYHYGPKPNPLIAHYLSNGNLFHVLRKRKYRVCYLNAFPPTYFESIASGRRLYSAIPLAVISAGMKLYTFEDLVAGRALSADFTAEGWRVHLGFRDVPVLSPEEAGNKLAEIASDFDFTFFEYWLSDYAGHHQNLAQATHILETLDGVLKGVVENWDLTQGMIWITSDHGNFEDLSHRRHTQNPVPLLLFGSKGTRNSIPPLHSLLDLYPTLLSFFP